MSDSAQSQNESIETNLNPVDNASNDMSEDKPTATADQHVSKNAQKRDRRWEEHVVS